MYVLKPGIKQDPQRQWALPDRIFFGHGACHILAGIYLEAPPLAGFRAEWIVPGEGFSGNHIYVTDGEIAFDYHGYSRQERLLAHHAKAWSFRFEGWNYALRTVDFDLLSTAALNARKMRGPDQYLFDAMPRARAFIHRVLHEAAAGQARALGGSKREPLTLPA